MCRYPMLIAALTAVSVGAVSSGDMACFIRTAGTSLNLRRSRGLADDLKLSTFDAIGECENLQRCSPRGLVRPYLRVVFVDRFPCSDSKMVAI